MTKSNNQPSHIVYHVKDGKEGKGFWTRIGSAWANADGNGFNIVLDCLPVDGRLSMRINDKKE